MNKRTRAAVVAASALSLLAVAGPASAFGESTTVPGQVGREGTVTGHYTQTDTDDNGVTCDYIVNYRGDFGTDPSLDNGWITNQIKCDDGSVTSYLIVHATDPRYTGDADRAIWGAWEIVKQTVKGEGNVANVHRPAYDPALVG